MNVPKLTQAIEGVKNELGGGMLACDLFAVADGQSIAGHNTQPKASALFNQLTDYLVKALRGSGFPGLGHYFLIDMEGNNMVVVVPLGEYRMGLLVDTKKVQLGLLLNVVLPQMIQDLRAAMEA